jgi:hypothetical protein
MFPHNGIAVFRLRCLKGFILVFICEEHHLDRPGLTRVVD